jgi:hypothetical protein
MHIMFYETRSAPTSEDSSISFHQQPVHHSSPAFDSRESLHRSHLKQKLQGLSRALLEVKTLFEVFQNHLADIETALVIFDTQKNCVPPGHRKLRAP